MTYKEATTAKWTDGALDTQYAIEVKGDTLLIKIQWTVSFVDWIYNFMFIPFFVRRPYSNMPVLFFVHRGFLKKYKAIRQQIKQAVINNPNKKIEIGGYSQGAAIAMLAHEDIVYTFGRRPETTVFGCPRVFSLFGKKELNKRLEDVTRYENGGDIVTKVPPVWMLYRHYGKKIHIGAKRLWYKLSIKDHTRYKEVLQ